MADLPIFVSVDGAQRLAKLSRELKDAGRGDLRLKLRREIRKAGRPAVNDLKTAVMAVDVSSSRGGGESSGLRAAVSKAIGVSTARNGIRIRVNSKRLPFRTAAKYLDGTIGRYDRWRHPVFGNQDVWVEQSGQPWFFVTVRRHTRDFRRAVFRVMDDITDELSR